MQLKESSMSTRPTAELEFVKSNEPLATVEVDIDSIPHEFYGYSDIVARCLQGFAANALKAKATVYVLQTDSVNFHEQTRSAFFALAGKGEALKFVYSAFEAIKGVRVRYSDYISPRHGAAQFHVQDGLVWQPEDSLSWYSYGENAETLSTAQHETEAPVAREASEAGEEGEDLIDAERLHTAPSSTNIQSGVRFRRARSDASVGAIKRSIETIFGLPTGSVKLCGPDGRPLRSDAEVRTLRKRWKAADR